ncbi:NmrA/HSCARG family protein [Rhizobium sp. CC-YZS058]|uniref:NmrA/HSCARG family protein n=1 Tax=Rhizobium sp. CC-YZS058 TaxID=3042153 RepID=UPI002B057309|nr:NmrA/HSCARG family protein [Rhizobium sp. CC-YZS058]MEA3537167.1 NmrA/HSCARG family protein [Rhizobium sp. CC-YZS058]
MSERVVRKAGGPEGSETGKTILVFGATGQQGGAVAKALIARGWAVSALVRAPDHPKAQSLSRLGITLFVGDFSDPGSLASAMNGVYGVFSVQPSSGQGAVYSMTDEQEMLYGKRVADIANQKGVRHFVYTSVNAAGPEKTGMGHFDSKSEIEAHLRSLPLTNTIIRPSGFMELLMLPGMGLDKGKFLSFVRHDQTAQVIAVEDIGRIVAAIFSDPARYGGRTLEIAGDEITGRRLEASLSRASGRPITFSRFPDGLLRENAFLGRLADLFDDGRLAGNADLEALRREFGPLLSFDDWLAGPGRPLLEKALTTPSTPLALR